MLDAHQEGYKKPLRPTRFPDGRMQMDALDMYLMPGTGFKHFTAIVSYVPELIQTIALPGRACYNEIRTLSICFQGDPIARMPGLNRWKLVEVQHCAATVTGE